MTVAIKRSNGTLIWFDAVLEYSKNYSAQISSHRLESGRLITDNRSVGNAEFSLSGVISDVDFNAQRPIISRADADSVGITNTTFVNNQEIPTDNIVIKSGDGALTRLLPESITQFLDDKPPSINIVEEVSRQISDLYLEQVFTDMHDAGELFTLIEFNGNKIRGQLIENCLIKNLSFKFDADSGEALWPVFQIEQVRFATSASVTLPQEVVTALKNKKKDASKKGKVSTKSEVRAIEPATKAADAIPDKSGAAVGAGK